MNTFFKYFKGSIAFTLIAVVCGYLLGGAVGATMVLLLGVLETSLSFDNAVVNSEYLQNMSAEWRHRFIMYGLPIAVFGMRLVFPLLIVSAVTWSDPWAVLKMAVEHPKDYAAAVTSAHHQVAAFGGAFLMMVFLKYFIDEEKSLHWFGFLEAPLAKMGRIEAIQVAVTLLAVVLSGLLLPDVKDHMEFLVAGALGVVTYVMADSLGVILGAEEGSVATSVAKSGLAGFLYLEVLDASFSFDGVIGAFALSDNLFLIALGLGVGAFFVRSLTLLLVDKGTLAEYAYLEHGAFWAVGFLALSMFIGVKVEIPEYVTGLTGAGLIGLALWSSVLANRRRSQEEQPTLIIEQD